MRKTILKAAAISPEMRLCDTAFNTEQLINAAHRASEAGADLVLFPELAISGATAADMYLSKTLTDMSLCGLKKYAEETRKLPLVSFVGVPLRIQGAVYDCIAAVSGGEILGAVPRGKLPRTLGLRTFSEYRGEEYTELFGKRILFSEGQHFEIKGFRAFVCFDALTDAAAIGADIILIPTAIPKTVGSYDRIKQQAISLSRSASCAVLVANAGYGESGTDALYDAQNVIAYKGGLLAYNEPFVNDALVFSSIGEDAPKPAPLKYEFSKASPFIPEDTAEIYRACSEIFEIQSRALAGRIKRAYAKCAVIGVSGGLDSTLAVLVAARAMDILGMPRNAVKAVTMPCFGTTARTKSNAQRLSVALGTDFITVDIKRSVMSHFEDIGHDPEDFSVVYENAQARERTQVIMDIANKDGGMVIGTGDLSELALGWATYNGDHMSMYGVNAGIPKTVIRHVTSYCADKAEADGDTEVAGILRDVLNTPVSPELLPPKDGEIAQCTEGIVGPYELHDFFLYHLLKSSASAREIYELAKAEFKNTEYTDEVIKGWLKVFFRRFFAQQFKRSCLPDGPMVYDISVSPRGGLSMPSDASAAIWLAEIDRL